MFFLVLLVTLDTLVIIELCHKVVIQEQQLKNLTNIATRLIDFLDKMIKSLGLDKNE